jgi:hypothetical protein
MRQHDRGELRGAARNPLIFRYSLGRLIVNCIEESAILDAIHYRMHLPQRFYHQRGNEVGAAIFCQR